MERRDGPTRVLVALIVVSAVAFAIGVAIEKSNHHTEHVSTASIGSAGTILIDGRPATLVSETAAQHAAEGGSTSTQQAPTTTTTTESAAKHASETGGKTTTTTESAAKHAVEAGGGTRTESAAKHAAEAAGGASGSETAAQHAGETHSEKLLGINPESTALVVIAVITSLLLAAAVWLWPDQALLLLVIAAAMFSFAALDIREAIHQSDESNGGLVALASVIAVLHLGAGCLAAYLARIRWSTAAVIGPPPASD